ncbi:uncharacterized protein [Anabrus simplex]|uniref:uncharacterized protein n=1 Tax=Anabrus simplex TaxID=316456 RepID=UPI0035A2D1FA
MTKASVHYNVSPNEIAHQLLLNGKVKCRARPPKFLRNIEDETCEISKPFVFGELENAIKICLVMSRVCTSLLLLLAAVRRLSADPGIFSEYSAASLVTDIQNHYSTGCIFLLYSNDMQHDLGRFVVSVEKYLSRRDIPSIAVPLEAFNYSRSWAQCLRNGPLYVILSSGKSTSRALQQRPPIAGPVWLLLLERTTIEEVFRGVSVPFNCELLVAERKGPSVHLTEVYRVAEGQPLTRKLYGKWSMRRVYNMKYSDLYDRRNNLGGHIFKAAVINDT